MKNSHQNMKKITYAVFAC